MLFDRFGDLFQHLTPVAVRANGKARARRVLNVEPYLTKTPHITKSRPNTKPRSGVACSGCYAALPVPKQLQARAITVASKYRSPAQLDYPVRLNECSAQKQYERER
jgi:hypothetical protein